jgi:hypothetical protein
VVRVGENSSVSVDVIAGFDVLSINSVPNQTHSSFILCYTHTLSGQRTPSALYYLLQQIKEEKVPLLPDWIGLDSIEIGPTHTLLFIHPLNLGRVDPDPLSSTRLNKN